MGIKAGSYWFSWGITGVIISAITSILVICIGMLFQFEFFLNTPFLYSSYFISSILFILFFITSVAMVMLAFMLSTILETKQHAYGVAFITLLIGVVLQILFSNIHLVYFLFYPEVPGAWVIHS